MRTLSDSERLDWLQLIGTETIGPISFQRLIARYGDAASALKALPGLGASKRGAIAIPERRAVEQALRRADLMGARAIASCEPDYPRLLNAIPDAPPVLYVRGAASIVERPCVAVIGARNASAIGRKIAREIASGVGAAGAVVVSGLARGIDTAAHEAALGSGTVAVMAGGLDVVYPPENAALMAEIAATGAVVSERPPGVEPLARDFPRRNRLISGLSSAVVIVEAAARSGTLSTASFAADQGREVLVVPGSPLDPRYEGSLSLLRNGAGIAAGATDVLEALAGQRRFAREPDRFKFSDGPRDNAGPVETAFLKSVEQQLLELVGFTPTRIDTLLREIDAPAGVVYEALLNLSLSGDIAELPGEGYVLPQDA